MPESSSANDLSYAQIEQCSFISRDSFQIAARSPIVRLMSELPSTTALVDIIREYGKCSRSLSVTEGQRAKRAVSVASAVVTDCCSDFVRQAQNEVIMPADAMISKSDALLPRYVRQLCRS